MIHPFENLPIRKTGTISTKYTKQFELWLKKQKAKGLQYINVYYGEGFNKDTVNYEKFCEEFMRMVNAPDVEDKEIFG